MFLLDVAPLSLPFFVEAANEMEGAADARPAVEVEEEVEEVEEEVELTSLELEQVKDAAVDTFFSDCCGLELVTQEILEPPVLLTLLELL